jgi:diguanylate cyclase (GGDEF)-like protein/PAS domain S-box-containing protein
MVIHFPVRDADIENCSLLNLLGPDVCFDVLDQLGIVSVTNSKGNIVYANDEFVSLSGYARSEFIGQNHRLVNSGYHSRDFFRDMYRTIASGKKWRAPIKNRAKDGTEYWVDALIIPLKNALGRIEGYLSVRLDITDAMQVHLASQERDLLLQAILDNFPGGIAVYAKSSRMVVCNEQQKKLLDYPESLFSAGPPKLEALLRYNAERGEYGEGDIDELINSRLELASRHEAHTYERQRPNGSFLEVRGCPLADGGFVSTHADITERKRDLAKIEELAQRDVLTGLANRRMLRERLQNALARVHRGDKLALLYLDLDRFKAVNDTLGHPVGDLVLQAVSDRLNKVTRGMDTVARLGGDEFAILQPGIETASDAAELARRIIQDVSAPYQIGGNCISIGTSIGIALAPQNSIDPDLLLKNADLALYQAKSSGRGVHRFFESEMDARMQRRRAIEIGLRAALENNQFEVQYQPIVSTIDRTITSCEALLRWYHPERGLISAADFVPIAEETGLIAPIGDWILKQACREAQRWPSNVSVSVNVSVAQFRNRDLRTIVLNSLEGLDPSRLVLEITESMLMQKDQSTVENLRRVREMGVRFALDDFGTGYSSLSYLQSFPFDKLKIDRSFIESTSENERSRKLLAAIAGLGRALNLATVAEGVETSSQFEFIKSQNCSEAQGYFFAPALPAERLMSLF